MALSQSFTKITLILRNDVDREDLEKQFFKDLPETLLLFLKKLRRIIVNRYDATETLSNQTTYTSNGDDTNRRATLTKVAGNGDSSLETTLTRYFITKRQLLNLPEHGQRKGHNSAEIILAFPVDEDDVPIIRRQDVYAYLPVGNFGFPARLSFSDLQWRYR